MKETLKKYFLQLVSKMGVATTGLSGWVVNLIMEKAFKALQAWAIKTWEHMKAIGAIKKEEKIDAQNVVTHEGTLQNGSTQQAQVDATLDLLNGKPKP